MKSKLLHLIIFIGVIFAFSACNDSIPLPEPEPVAYKSIAIVYWMGDNTLSSAAESDIQELVKGKDNIPDSCKIIIYADRVNDFPVIYELDAANGLKEWKKYTKEEDCTDSLTLLSNLRAIVKNFPAKSYGLTFGSHGSGWVMRQRRALGPDQSHNSNWMNIPTLRGVLEHLPHFNYIFFDVCFMQCIEVAYELRDVTDWIIGSPAEIPGPGADYRTITGALCKGDIESIVEGYNNAYPTIHFDGVILSATKCSELESLAAITKTYITNAFANRQTISSGEAQNIQKYSSSFSDYTYCYDMNSAMSNILSTASYGLWNEEFKKAVPLRKKNTGRWSSPSGICNNPTIYDSEHFGGISMYIPQDDEEGNKKNTELRQYQWYKDAGWEQAGW